MATGITTAYRGGGCPLDVMVPQEGYAPEALIRRIEMLITSLFGANIQVYTRIYCTYVLRV